MQITLTATLDRNNNTKNPICTLIMLLNFGQKTPNAWHVSIHDQLGKGIPQLDHGLTHGKFVKVLTWEIQTLINIPFYECKTEKKHPFQFLNLKMYYYISILKTESGWNDPK